MKTNLLLAAFFIIVILFVLNFLKDDYKSSDQINQPIATTLIIDDINNTDTRTQTKSLININNQKTALNTQPIKTIEVTANLKPTPAPAPATTPQDDRILFEGIDFKGITNFKIIVRVDETIFLPSTVLPIFGPTRELFSIVKIGTSDQGDVYFNGGRELLNQAINSELDNTKNIVVFTKDEMTIESNYNNNQLQFNFDVVVDSQSLDSISLLGNQLPACIQQDTRDISITGNTGSLNAQPCEQGYQQLDELDLIEIKDPVFYGCITNYRDSTVNLGDPRIKKGWVNKNDIISIDCTPAIIKSADEIIHFPNLQKIVVSSDFPNFELFKQLPNLKYLSIYNYNNTVGSFDAQQLSDLENLQFFSAYNINIISSNYLANLNNLKSLILTSVIIDNYEFAKFLTQVKYFDISNNQLDIFPEIGFYESIETIHANSNNFDNINGFETFTNLRILLLRNNNIYSVDNLDLEHSKYEKIELFANPINCNQAEMKKYSFMKVKCSD
ncbi:MAG: hypothetical protein HRU38_18855 [Saccharospirillaceae bacterium]|nr:hypothetical protein [Pseudomonadales bacterium]NRB80695.1 hypothetical protein [Saccharospirillaceae bacterium]